MSRRAKQIGFSQRVRLEWVDQTAELVMAGNEQATVNAALQDLLKDKVSVGGVAERGTREKIISILLKMWLTVPHGLEGLRDDALKILRRLPLRNRIAVHWGMALAAYPFWGAVASQTGRLLRLQGTAAAAHVQRRVREQYGERETVSRAARRVLRSFIDWGVLRETGTKGIYGAGASLAVDDPRLIGWLVEVSLHARFNGSAPLRELLDSPVIFPFQLKSVHAESLLAASANLDILRHGLDEDLVILRNLPTKRGAP